MMVHTYRPRVNVSHKRLSRYPRIKEVLSLIIVPVTDKVFAYIFHFRTSEGYKKQIKTQVVVICGGEVNPKMSTST
jgi:hypothetical protein